MIKNSNIEWTALSWNPWRGCVKKTIQIDGQIKLREECRNCYMYREQRRYGRRPELVVRAAPATFNKPLAVQKEVEKGLRPNFEDRLMFTCSWSDWNNPEADQWRPEAWKVIRECPDLIFQILTKLPQRMLDHLPPFWDEIKDRCWVGASCGYQPAYDEMLPHLLKIPAPVHFLSCEPLLGPVDLHWCQWCGRFGEHDCESGYPWAETIEQDQAGVDWVIGGGESGPGARPCHPNWATSLRDQCQAAGIPFFFKQWGEFVPDCQWTPEMGMGQHLYAHDHLFIKVGKRNAGRSLDGQLWNEFPAIEVAEEYVDTNVGRFKREVCQHTTDDKPDCTELGEPCWVDSWTTPDYWYCAKHMKEEGFCIGCHQFYAGIESFDFGPGWCSNCAPEFEDDEYDPDLDFGYEFDPYKAAYEPDYEEE